MNIRIFSLLSVIIFGSVLLGVGCAGKPTANRLLIKESPEVVSTTVLPTVEIQTSTNEKRTIEAVVNRVNISISNFDFQPNVVSVPVSSTVTWTNNDNVPHTVSADDGSFSSGTMLPGSNFSHIFTVIGKVAYHCAFHSSMRGNVVVK